mmetsp:Transcript_13040/g.38979  ORF Transcript_13040/g.38979 Transcript_13040/m.38979 type:complete len:796 (-) Transcript_13040:18-2405(-)
MASDTRRPAPLTVLALLSTASALVAPPRGPRRVVRVSADGGDALDKEEQRNYQRLRLGRPLRNIYKRAQLLEEWQHIQARPPSARVQRLDRTNETETATALDRALADANERAVQSDWETLQLECGYLNAADQARVHDALRVAHGAHAGQQRRSGEPFIVHPVAVARLLAGLGMDRETVVAGLLHDTVEDTELTFEEVEAMFGTDVRNIVEGETKVSKLPKMARELDSPSWDAEREQVENMRSMFIAMAEDWRVVVVKLADRLHNMRTLEFMPPEKRAKISRETLEIFAPLAHRLGIWTYKTELEETSFRHLYPGEYRRLEAAIRGKRLRYEAALSSCRQQLEEMLYADELIQGRTRTIQIEGRTKSAYSTWKKMQRQQCGLERIDDLVALRVVLRAENETSSEPYATPQQPSQQGDTALCYHVLGKVHGRWTPLPRTLKDYISSPKPNGYRSLHTTVLVGSQPLEVQIRTDEMHRVAELGAAAHWAYKDDDASLPWLQIIRQWHAQVDSSSVFMQLVRNELLGSRVFVFAPQGRILNLAKGATLADAVAHIVADEASWGGGMGEDYLALVNAVEEPRDYGLRNGDIVSFAPRGDDLAEEMPEEALVGGAEAVAWPLCSFCRPLPGDTVLGCAAQHSRRGTVHRADCDCEVLRRELERPGARLVDGAALAMNDDDYDAVRRALAPDLAERDARGDALGFSSSIVVFARDRTRMLLDVSQAVSVVNIVDVMSETRDPGGRAAFQYTIHVDDVDHLNEVFDSVLAVPDVTRVIRGSMRLLKRKGNQEFWDLGEQDDAA